MNISHNTIKLTVSEVFYKYEMILLIYYVTTFWLFYTGIINEKKTIYHMINMHMLLQELIYVLATECKFPIYYELKFLILM